MPLNCSPDASARHLGLPAGVRGCLFDMDGVLTRTASLHAAAWKEMFDEFLARRSRETGEPFVSFDDKNDYDLYVDGRSRADGTRGFLASRNIEIPEGNPDDAPAKLTVYGLSNRKNEILLRKLDQGSVQVFDDAIAYVREVQRIGLPRAVVSASANTAQVLDAAGISGLFDARIDGIVAATKHLAGKPAPDMYLAGARALGLEAPEAAVFEDALAGVAAGRAGRFGYVVGVDRVGQREELKASGADIVVNDLTDLISPA